MYVYRIQEIHTISMQALLSSWHRPLLRYIKRVVLALIMCKQRL